MSETDEIVFAPTDVEGAEEATKGIETVQVSKKIIDNNKVKKAVYHANGDQSPDKIIVDEDGKVKAIQNKGKISPELTKIVQGMDYHQNSLDEFFGKLPVFEDNKKATETRGRSKNPKVSNQGIKIK